MPSFASTSTPPTPDHSSSQQMKTENITGWSCEPENIYEIEVIDIEQQELFVKKGEADGNHETLMILGNGSMNVEYKDDNLNIDNGGGSAYSYKSTAHPAVNNSRYNYLLNNNSNDGDSRTASLFPVLKPYQDEQISQINEDEIFYFEVKLLEGICFWVGFVQENDAKYRNISDSSRNYPYRVICDEFPGYGDQSIGLSTTGELFFDGSMVDCNGDKVDNRPDPWCNFSFKHGDVLGCGLNSRSGRIIFTRNGLLLRSDQDHLIFNPGKFIPAVSMVVSKQNPASLRTNFGLDTKAKPFLWKSNNSCLSPDNLPDVFGENSNNNTMNSILEDVDVYSKKEEFDDELEKALEVSLNLQESQNREESDLIEKAIQESMELEKQRQLEETQLECILEQSALGSTSPLINANSDEEILLDEAKDCLQILKDIQNGISNMDTNSGMEFLQFASGLQERLNNSLPTIRDEDLLCNLVYLSEDLRNSIDSVRENLVPKNTKTSIEVEEAKPASKSVSNLEKSRKLILGYLDRLQNSDFTNRECIATELATFMFQVEFQSDTKPSLSHICLDLWAFGYNDYLFSLLRDEKQEMDSLNIGEFNKSVEIIFALSFILALNFKYSPFDKPHFDESGLNKCNFILDCLEILWDFNSSKFKEYEVEYKAQVRILVTQVSSKILETLQFCEYSRMEFSELKSWKSVLRRWSSFVMEKLSGTKSTLMPSEVKLEVVSSITLLCKIKGAESFLIEFGLIKTLLDWIGGDDTTLKHSSCEILIYFTTANSGRNMSIILGHIATPKVLKQILSALASADFTICELMIKVLSCIIEAVPHVASIIVSENGYNEVMDVFTSSLQDDSVVACISAASAGSLMLQIFKFDASDEGRFSNAITSAKTIVELGRIVKSGDCSVLRLLVLRMLNNSLVQVPEEGVQRLSSIGIIQDVSEIMKRNSFRLHLLLVSNDLFSSPEKMISDFDFKVVVEELYEALKMFELIFTADQALESPVTRLIFDQLVENEAFEALARCLMIPNHYCTSCRKNVAFSEISHENILLAVLNVIKLTCSPLANEVEDGNEDMNFLIDHLIDILSIVLFSQLEKSKNDAKCVLRCLQAIRIMSLKSECKPLIINRVLPNLVMFGNSEVARDISTIVFDIVQTLIGNAEGIFETDSNLIMDFVSMNQIVAIQEHIRDMCILHICNDMQRCMDVADSDEMRVIKLFPNIQFDENNFKKRKVYIKQLFRTNNHGMNFNKEYKAVVDYLMSVGLEPKGEIESETRNLLVELYHPSKTGRPKPSGNFLDILDRLQKSSLLEESLTNEEELDNILQLFYPSFFDRKRLFPLNDFTLDLRLNSYSLIMPERKYFSFRREGQVVYKFCNAERENAVDREYTLTFKNSSFGGEFAESLLHTLSSLPNVTGLCFTKALLDESARENDGSPLLAHLTVSLPSWINNLTFDNSLTSQSLNLLVDLLSARVQQTVKRGKKSRQSLTSLCIQNCPHILEKSYESLFQKVAAPIAISIDYLPLFSLHTLALGGNKLGSGFSAKIFSIINYATANLVNLDLSNNNIGKGIEMIEVLKTYASSSVDNMKSCQLKALNIASNNLRLGALATHLMDSLSDDILPLKFLDLSNNGLTGEEMMKSQPNSVFSESLIICLKTNSSLVELDLSKNSLSSAFLNKVVNSGDSLHAIHIQDNEVQEDIMSQAQENQIEILRRRCLRRKTSGLIMNKSIEGVEDKTEPNERYSPEDKNEIIALFSAPLVWKSRTTEEIYPIDNLAQVREREVLQNCLKEASMDIGLSFDCATTERMQSAMSKGSKCLHFSGHGHELSLTFEDGAGGLHMLTVDALQEMMLANGRKPFSLVFVSACHSLLAGETFVNGGVNHVVCCQQEAQVSDDAALAFTRSFYLALAIGRTVKESFDIAREAVASAPSVPQSSVEKDKFVLLPLESNHDVPIFSVPRVAKWPEQIRNKNIPSVRRLVYLPVVPMEFLGREVIQYLLLQNLLTRRFVSLIGIPGSGRTSLASAVCNYILDRKNIISEIDHIFYIRASSSNAQNASVDAYLKALYCQFVEERLVPDEDFNILSKSSLRSNILHALGASKSLIVLDDVEKMGGIEDCARILIRMLQETSDLKILVISDSNMFKNNLIDGIGHYNVDIGPLTFKDTVTLFTALSSHLHTRDERKKFKDSILNHLDESVYSLTTADEFPSHSKALEIFKFIGVGIPSRICNASHNMDDEKFKQLLDIIQWLHSKPKKLNKVVLGGFFGALT